MTITESQIENFAITLLQNQGYQYFLGSDITAQSSDLNNKSEFFRQSYDEVVLENVLRKAIERINPQIPEIAKTEALRQVLRIAATDLEAANEEFHQMLTSGVKVSYQKDGETRGDLVWLVDFENRENNEFFAINQFSITHKQSHKRPDLVLFVNGLPLVVLELKNAALENATLNSAYKQLQTYKETIPALFVYNAFLVISDGLEAKAGSLSASLSRFMAWKTADGKEMASKLALELEILTKGMLGKGTLLDLVKNFITFEKSSFEDAKTKIVTIKTVKKLAAYHQYYAVNKAVESVKKAASEKGDKKGGVIWHTQGSGKSLSMVFASAKLIRALDNPTILIITDRNDLDDQLFDTFAASKQLLRQDPIQAESRQDLKKLLKVASGGVVFTTIQKFQPEVGNVFEELSTRKNIVVIADEAHRTQYGFHAKTIDDKDEKGNVIGKKVVYGFAKYMRDALPNATYLGFTGTPIEGTDINTPAVFGSYVDVYDISSAVNDGATVPIFYESRLAKVNLSEEGKELVKQLDDDLEEQDLSDTQKAKAKWTQLEALIGSENRIKNIAADIVNHFSERQKVFDGKAMIVAMSRRIAADLYEEIIRLKPEWHSDDLGKGAIKVIMTASSSDGPKMAKHHTTKEERRALAERMKSEQDELKLVIVRDMWLTGFDAPSMTTLYIDKPMKGHNLMQAIARVNRVYKDKKGGLVVDYLGIASDLKKALSFYSDSGGKGDPAIAQSKAIEMMQVSLEVIEQMFYGFDYSQYFKAETAKKLSLILAAENHILGLENGKKRFIDEVAKLSQAFAIAVPSNEAMEAKDEVAFFQAIKARLVKFESSTGTKSDAEIETAIRQVIDEALVSSKVVDVFDAAGIKKPDISILSEEFLLEIKSMQHQNLALETLKKLLNDEIKARSKRNLVQGKSLMEMLTNSIKKYHNKIITAAEVIEELIKLSKNIVKMDSDAKNLNLSDFEYGFYVAVSENQSARELMQKDKLRELAVVLAEKIKQNATIDWTIKESVQAQLRVIVKKVLRQFGYPPDMEKLATETILKQAELIAEELTKN